MSMIDLRANPEELSDISSFELIDSAPANPQMNGSECHGTTSFRMNTLPKASLQVGIYLTAQPNNTYNSLSKGRINATPLFIYLSNFTVTFEYIMQAWALLGKREMQQRLLSRPQEQLHKEEGTEVPRSQMRSRHQRNEILQLTCCKEKCISRCRPQFPGQHITMPLFLFKCCN